MKFPDLTQKIKKLKKERRAVILAHNYQLPEVQDVADFRGDSLELSRIAAKTDAEVIVFCGVHFMAETASIIVEEGMVSLPRLVDECHREVIQPLELLDVSDKKHIRAFFLNFKPF